ncbi:hypothetical protein BI364_16425 [Acidihalobacter yilgarnensis]|uniref:DUF945 domain-containing protein n=1 Tax=Acidihalobacter yilgarnensis TaxID=2819280 RepID=A0A1D8ISB9_9GAMM|nr:DUF945 family protein [Acidihalobacter yilgarnensis]AOU99303.1 hypothetical protein BI364_16425 [Acidihalobacter yilgarnensis]
MKKVTLSLGVLAALLAAVAGLGPLYTSQIANREIASAVTAINQQGLFEARYVAGTHGWFSQSDTLTLKPVERRWPDTQRRLRQAIVLHLHIAYGPLPFAAWARDGVSLMPVGAVIDTRVEGLDRILSRADSGYRLHDVVTLGASNTFTLQVDAGHMTNRNGLQMRWSQSNLVLMQSGQRLHGHGRSGTLTVDDTGPLRTHLQIDPITLDIDHLHIVDGQAIGKMALSWGGFDARNFPNKSRPPQDVRLGELRMSVDSHLSGGIAAGQGTMSLSKLVVRQHGDTGTPQFALNGVEISSSTTDPKDGYADSSMSWNLKQFDMNGDQYSPAGLTVEMNHLYVPALIDTMRTLREAEHRLQPQGGEPPKQAMQRLFGLLIPSAQVLLAHEPVLRLSGLRLGTPQGILTGQGEARLEPANGATPSVTTLPQDLVASLKLSAPPSLARHLATLFLARQGVPVYQLAQASQRYLDNLRNQGFLSMREGNYALDLGYGHGSLTFNGKEIGVR